MPRARSPRRSALSPRLQAEQDRIEQIARSAPAVITEAEDLDRDYGVLKKNYQELVSRREATLIADAADTKTEKIQFRIVDPPQVPLVPAEPNRPLLVSLVLLGGIGAGIAAPLGDDPARPLVCHDQPSCATSAFRCWAA